MANVVNDTMYNQLKQLYGGDAGKASKAKAQIESSYSTDQYNKLVSGLNAKYGSGTSTTTTPTTSQSVYDNSQAKSNEIMNKAENTSNTINSLINQTSKMSGEPVEYQGQGGTTTKDPSSSPYVNQGQGQYTYNPQSGYYEVQGQTTQTQGGEKIRQYWDSLSYEEQQQKLNENPNLRASLSKYGATEKQQEVKPEAKQEGGETPSERDYQSDSPERMAEIAANLEGYKQTMPYLFNDKRAFDDFFINGKGRSQAQIDFLNQWFENNKKYGKYDALTPDSIGYGIAYGDIPEDYLTMLKTTDPAKYQAALQAKQDAEDKIKDKTSLDTTSVLSGESEDTITSKAIEWLKSQGLFLDNDGNLIDDRTENYATDEEKQYAKDAADIIARNLDIDNTVKHTYEDLVKKYPGATKATLMAMAQDINADLLREKENNNVELTRLQGYMDYMQSERQERTRIGENAINQLQKQYGMYYQYTPQGMSELAQAQYAATNVTLDQADYGTDTQKQMALQSVLDDYYAKYGDIIQRSEAQVINDVMAYAKKNGVSLSQALEENFTKFLKEKPAYQAMQASMANVGWDIKNVYVDGEQQSVWYNPITQETKPLGYSYDMSNGKFNTISLNDFGEGDYQKLRGEVQSAMREWATEGGNLEDAVQNIVANMDGTYLGANTCGYYVNDIIYGLTGVQGPFGSDIADKRSKCTNTGLTGAKVGDAIVFDRTISPEGLSGVLPEYGHVGIITGFDEDTGAINVSSTIGGKVQTKTIKPGDAWYRNIYGTRSLEYSGEKYGYGENPMSNYLAELGKLDLNADQKKDLKFVTQSYNLLYRIASSGDLDHLINSGDLEKLIQNMNSKAFQSTEGDKTFSAVKSMLTKNISDQTNLKTIGDIAELITLKLRKESGAAISAGEWASGFESFLPGAGEDYNTSFAKYIRFEQDYLMPSLTYVGGDRAHYKPLFSPNSPYYKKDDSTTGGETPGTTSKGTWDISGTTGQGSVVGTPSPYSSLFNQLNLE